MKEEKPKKALSKETQEAIKSAFSKPLNPDRKRKGK